MPYIESIMDFYSLSREKTLKKFHGWENCASCSKGTENIELNLHEWIDDHDPRILNIPDLVYSLNNRSSKIGSPWVQILLLNFYYQLLHIFSTIAKNPGSIAHCWRYCIVNSITSLIHTILLWFSNDPFYSLSLRLTQNTHAIVKDDEISATWLWQCSHPYKFLLFSPRPQTFFSFIIFQAQSIQHQQTSRICYSLHQC